MLRSIESDEFMNADLEKSREYWNRRAATFGAQCGGRPSKSSYVGRFLKLLETSYGVSTDTTILDMGCATGTLAVPLATKGCRVIACDFSPRMIEKLETIASEEKLPIACKLMAWEDDWDAHGVSEKCVDVALASRSLGSSDIRQSLQRLDSSAREFVAMTVSAGAVPAYEPRLMEYLGRTVPKRDEVITIIRTLFDMKRFPCLSYIPCERPMRFADIETAYMELSRMAGPEPMNVRERHLFDQYAREHFRKEATEAGTVYQLDYTLIAPWAFIGWSTRGEV